MKILFLTANGELNGLAQKLSPFAETKVFVLSILAKAAGMEFLNRVPAWRPEMSWADLIVSDYQLNPAEQTAIREWGRLSLGIGDVEFLNDKVQKSIPDSIHYSVIALWNGRKLLSPGFVLFEDKALLAGNLGPNLGVMANATIGEELKLSKELITSTVESLIKTNYRGPIRFDFQATEEKQELILTSAKIDGLTLAAILPLLQKDPIDFLVELAGGTLAEIEIKNETSSCIRVYVPPWPYLFPQGIFLQGEPQINPKIHSHLWLIDAWRSIDEDCFKFGASGNFAFAVAAGRKGKGDIFREAIRRAKRVITGIEYGLLQHRADACDSVYKSYEQLKRWGWI